MNSFEIKMSRQYIKIIRNTIRVQTLLVIMNIGFIIFNSYHTFHNQSMSNAFGLGCFWVNLIWSILYLVDSLQDMRFEKEKLNFLEKQDINKWKID